MDISKLLRAALLFFAAQSLVSCAARDGADGGGTTLSSAHFALQTLDGESYDIKTLTNNNAATVLVFWSPSCPCVRRYQERTDALLDHYSSKGVAVLAVASNAGEDRKMIAEATKQRGIRVPVLMDTGGYLADHLGARTTPTAAVLDSKGALRFLGWIDNERLPGEDGRIAYVENAVDAVLAGSDDYSPRSPYYGCAITKPLGGVGICLEPSAQ